MRACGRAVMSSGHTHMGMGHAWVRGAIRAGDSCCQAAIAAPSLCLLSTTCLLLPLRYYQPVRVWWILPHCLVLPDATATQLLPATASQCTLVLPAATATQLLPATASQCVYDGYFLTVLPAATATQLLPATASQCLYDGYCQLLPAASGCMMDTASLSSPCCCYCHSATASYCQPVRVWWILPHYLVLPDATAVQLLVADMIVPEDIDVTQGDISGLDHIRQELVSRQAVGRSWSVVRQPRDGVCMS